MATIDKILKNDLCLGCGLCEAVNKDCKMRLTHNGFYRPTFSSRHSSQQDEQIRRLCPSINIDTESNVKSPKIWGHTERVINAWASDKTIRDTSSSGGITSALAIYLLESHEVDAVLHVGVCDDTHLYNKLQVSSTRDEVLSRNASRYAAAAVFNEILTILDSDNRTYCFVGKPCDIAGIKNLFKEYPQYTGRIKYFLAIFCAGMPSYGATKEALATFGKDEEPISLRYRGDGWPGYFKATYSDGTVCKMTYNESWGKILGRRLGFRCKICPDGIGLLADIASGDAWNTKDGYPDFTEAEGRNFCFVRTASGDNLIHKAKQAGYIETEPVNVQDIKSMQRYQYDRRHLVGGRIAIVQLMTGRLCRFKGFGYYKILKETPKMRLIKDMIGTAKRFFKLRKEQTAYGKCKENS